MAATFHLAGLTDYVAALRDLPTGLASDVRPELASTAADVVASLRAAYPSRTGQLRASVQARPLSTNSAARVATEITVTAPYVRFVEFGTSRTRSQPTFGPTVRRGRVSFVQDIKTAVKARGLQVVG